tara:strand:- start:559 stop:1179 length:621 start_codon:yes stop_codon:yes gene_type:complete
MGAMRTISKAVIDRQKSMEEKAKYWDRRNESDKAREAVGKGLDARASFKPINLDEFAQEKRDSARRKRADRRGIRRNKELAREDYYRRQMREKRRQNEMRQPKEEMGGVGVLGARNPYGDDAVWDNERRSWAPNPKTDTVNKWNNYKNQAQTAGQGQTNLFGQSRGVSFGPGSSARGTINEEGQGDNRDFKKLYEELLKIHNASKK